MQCSHAFQPFKSDSKLYSVLSDNVVFLPPSIWRHCTNAQLYQGFFARAMHKVSKKGFSMQSTRNSDSQKSVGM